MPGVSLLRCGSRILRTVASCEPELLYVTAGRSLSILARALAAYFFFRRFYILDAYGAAAAAATALLFRRIQPYILAARFVCTHVPCISVLAAK